METKKYFRTHFEFVDAYQITEPIDIRLQPDSLKVTTFPAGSYRIKYPNGQEGIMEEWIFEKHFKETKVY